MKERSQLVFINSSALGMQNRYVVWITLLLILMIGLTLRIWGTSFGLPYIYHPDEGFEVNRALQLGTGSFDFSRMGKGGYFYVIFLEFGLLYVLMKIAGLVDTTRDFALMFMKDPTVFYLVGRITTAIIGTISIFLTYHIGKKVFSETVGIIAALLLCFNVLHAQHSHYITVDIPLTFLCLASLLFMIQIAERGKSSDYCWASVFLGLATITKLPGILLLIPLAVSHIIYSSRTGGFGVKSLINSKVLLAALLFSVVFFVGNPGALIYFDSYIKGALSLFEPSANTTTEIIDSSYGEHNSTNIGFYLQVIKDSMGLAIMLLSLVGVVLVVTKKKPEAFILLIFGVCFFVTISLSTHEYLVYPRYVLPIIPIMLLFSAVGITYLLSFGRKRIKNVEVISVALAMILASGSILASVQQSISFTREDSRTEAKKWFESNVPEDSRVLIEGFTARPFPTTVPLRNSRKNIENAIEYFRSEGVEEAGKAKYFSLELEAVDEKRFDLLFYGGDQRASWDFYRNSDVEYVVVQPQSLKNNPKYSGIGEMFLSELRADPDYHLKVVFRGEEAGRRGPLIEIYKRD